MDATLPLLFNVVQCHSLASLTVTILSCSLQLPLDLSLSLSPSLPLLYSSMQRRTRSLLHLTYPPDYHYTQLTEYTHSGQIPAVTMPLQYRQAQEIFYWRHLVWSQYVWGWQFPTMALWFFCDQSQKSPPSPRTRMPNTGTYYRGLVPNPPGPGPPKWRQNYIHP